jgi:hypothetical protein
VGIDCGLLLALSRTAQGVAKPAYLLAVTAITYTLAANFTFNYHLIPRFLWAQAKDIARSRYGLIARILLLVRRVCLLTI